jgi:hypothetical protein
MLEGLVPFGAWGFKSPLRHAITHTNRCHANEILTRPVRDRRRNATDAHECRRSCRAIDCVARRSDARRPSDAFERWDRGLLGASVGSRLSLIGTSGMPARHSGTRVLGHLLSEDNWLSARQSWLLTMAFWRVLGEHRAVDLVDSLLLPRASA